MKLNPFQVKAQIKRSQRKTAVIVMLPWSRVPIKRGELCAAKWSY
jgi:hypothetical protein